MSQVTKEYFKKKAPDYDNVDSQYYWVFSDELLWHLLTSQQFLPSSKESPFRFIDLGAGTGRWTFKILLAYPRARAFLIDQSAEMLEVASRKLKKFSTEDRAEIEIEDLQNLDRLEKAPFDYALCLHNVIGFFSDAESLLKNLFDKMKKGGKVAAMFPSVYHAIYFCNACRKKEEIDRIIEEKRVKYNDDMPSIRVFEIEEIETLIAECGFKNTRFYGFPVTIYPKSTETLIEGSTKELSDLLTDLPYREKLLSVEKRLCVNPRNAPRGNNLLVVFEK